MNKGTAVVILIVVLGGGYGLGRLATRGKDDGGNTASASVAKPSAADSKNAVGIGDGVERVRVPLEGPAKGPADAKVNIVVFSDFQCPFCSRVVPTIDKIEKEYGNEVRVFFRHNPLPFHQDAPLASEAALAAEAQGKFWQMHDKLFANQQNIKRPDLEKYAQELGLDMGKFKAGARQRHGQGAHRRGHGGRASRSACRGRRTSSSTAATSRARSRSRSSRRSSTTRSAAPTS